MADGLGSRWEHKDIKYKQLITINSVPLIYRTVQQISLYTNDILVIAPEEFEKYLNVQITTLGYRNHEDRPLLDGILRTKPFWKSPTLILLGDVIFSNYAIECLFKTEISSWILGRIKPNTVTGKQASELFSLRFDPKLENIEHNLSVSLNSGSGKLWDYYYRIQPTIISINDYTDDIDSPQAYDEFYEQMNNAACKDDKD